MSSPDQWLENALIFGVYPNGGGGGGGVTPAQVQSSAFNYESATGVNDAFIVNLSPPVTTLTDGLIVSMSSGALENLTSSPTLQINALTPVDILIWGGSPAPGDIQPNSSYLFIYTDAQNSFELINPSTSTANTFLTQAGLYNSGVDFGAVNAYEINLTPEPIGSTPVGFPLIMRVGAANTNTGASTLTVNTVTNDIVLNGGVPLPAGALAGGQMAYLLYNGSDWVLMNYAPSATGTEYQVLVNGTVAIRQYGDVVLTLPQDIDPTSSPTFDELTLDGGLIRDVNNNVALAFATQDVSSINYPAVVNGGAGSGVQYTAAGGSPNIEVSLLSKNEGKIVFGSAAATNQYDFFSGLGLQHQTIFNFSDTANSRTVTWQDSNGTVAFISDLTADVESVTGTTNEIEVNNTDPQNPIIELPDSIRVASSILDTNSNRILRFVPATTPVNYLDIQNSAAGSPAQISAEGTDTNIVLNLTSKGVSEIRLLCGNTTRGIRVYNGTGLQHNTLFSFANTLASRVVTFPDADGTLLMTGQSINSVPSITFSSTSGIIGTTTNNNAAAGSVGEFISATLTSASAIALTTATPATITSIELTAGDWDISWALSFETQATTSITRIQGGNALTTPALASNTISTSQFSMQWSSFVPGVETFQQNGARARQSLSAPTTIYLNANAVFSVAGLSAYGWISARRVR